MPLNTKVKNEVSKNIEKYEGRVSHLYLDTVGKVTVGVGHMVPNKAAMANVVMYKKGANNSLTLATLAEKYAEYEAIKKLSFGQRFGASSYKKHTTLVMKDTDINTQRNKHVQSFYKELTGYYTTANGFAKDFDAMPVDGQKGLFDMVFNLGITKLKGQYTKMNFLIKQRKWAEAAKESNRKGIGPTRNKLVKSLFNAAEVSIKKTP